MGFWAFTKRVVVLLAPLAGLVFGIAALGVAAFRAVPCVLSHAGFYAFLLFFPFLLVYLHELGHYLPVRRRVRGVVREGIFGVAVEIEGDVPWSAVVWSAVLPLVFGLGVTLWTGKGVFLLLTLGVLAASALDGVEVLRRHA
ncbi:MAG: hypothetical protein KM296_04990 [Brockia lithotrophica]|nr:hypothetical protein [Brockia lithotrophica]